MCKNVQNSAVIADIFMKFDTNVLNWILDGKIIEFSNTNTFQKLNRVDM